MKKLSLLQMVAVSLFLQMFFIMQALAQVASIQGSSSNLCPGKTYTYSWLKSGICTTPLWDPMGGGSYTNQRETTTSSGVVSSVDVTWYNNATGVLKVSCGNSSTTLNVTIKNVATPQFTVTSPYFIACGTGSQQICVNSVTNATHYKWTYPTGITGPATTTVPCVTITYTENASGNITAKGSISTTDCSYDGPPATLAITRKAGRPTQNSITQTELCTGETLTAEVLTSLPTGYSYQWVATNGLLVNGVTTSDTSPYTTTSRTVTIKNSGTSGGRASVKVRLKPSGACDASDWAIEHIQAGTITSDQIQISGPTQACPYQTVYFSIYTFELEGWQSFEWAWPSDWTYLRGQGTASIDFQLPYNFTGGTIIVRAKNRCGISGSPKSFYVSGGYSCTTSLSEASLVVSPNPSSDYIDVSLKKEKTDKEKDGEEAQEINIKIYDKEGRLRKTADTNNGKAHIKTADLENGLYYLVAVSGKESVRKQIIVNR